VLSVDEAIAEQQMSYPPHTEGVGTVENIEIEATEMSPSVILNFQENIIDFRGECYMENATEFFKPIIEGLAQHLDGLDTTEFTAHFGLTYFNSTSARFFMRVFDQLEAAAGQGTAVSIFWHFDEEDDAMEEQGEEFGEDLKFAKFELKSFAE
jgi:hypothetical protein